MINRLHRWALLVADLAFRSYCFLVRPQRHGVYIVVWWEDRILLVQNSYRRELTLPSGGIKSGEQPRDAALRELKEEVSIRAGVDDLVSLGQFDFEHDHMRDDVHAYELRFSDAPVIAVDNREVVQYQFVTVNDALASNLSQVACRLLERYVHEDGINRR